MLLKKQVRGGVLLYALFMAGIFTLLLHVYLERVVASSRQEPSANRLPVRVVSWQR